jgi:hypothetical protein
VEKRKHEVYGVGRCDHQAPYRPVIWDNIPFHVPKLVKSGKSPEEALQLAKEMCKNVPNLYNECVDLAELHYNSIERVVNSTPTAIVPNVESGSKSFVNPYTQSSPNVYKESNLKENYCDRKNNMLLNMTLFFVVLLIIIFFIARLKMFKV